MKILSIGNSFSQDPHAYLHALTVNEGCEIKAVNLYYGACSLKRHNVYLNSGEAKYHYELNGTPLYLDDAKTQPRYISIQDALTSDDWDIVTMQQVSDYSGEYETYQPFLNNLSAAVRKYCPRARQMIQQTWVYDVVSTHPAYPKYNSNQAEMYERVLDCYRRASEDVGAPLIRSGEVIQRLRALPEFDVTNGGLSLCRDTFHMSYSYGRYAVAAVWFATLFQRPLNGNGFVPSACGPEYETLLPIIRKTVNEYILG